LKALPSLQKHSLRNSSLVALLLLACAEAEWLIFKHWAGYETGLLIGTVCIGAGIICVSTSRNIQVVSSQLKIIKDMIEHLEDNEPTIYAPDTHAVFEETEELAQAVTALHTHFETTKISRELATNIKYWHWEVMNGLVTTLRHHLD